MSDTLNLPRSRGRLVVALIAGLALGVAGCDRDDSVDVALRKAQNSLSSVTPAQKTYNEVLTSLQSVAQKGAASQKAAASGLIAQAHAGLAEEPAAAVGAIEQETLSAIVQLRALHSQFLTYSAMAEAAGAYDPAAELAEVEKQMGERDQEHTALQQKKADLDAEIAKLEQQAKQLLEQGNGKRAEAATLKGQVANQSATKGEQLTIQARDLDREADGLEVQSATLDAQAAKVRPDSQQAQLDIGRVEQQKALLVEARKQIEERTKTARAQSAEARAEAQKVADKIKELADSTQAKREGDLTRSADEAINRYQQAAAAANQSAQGGSAAAAQVSVGAHQQSLGDIYWSRAQGLTAWGEVLGALAASKPPVPGSDAFQNTSVACASQAKEMLDKATEAYEAANSAYQASGQSGSNSEVQQRVNRLNELLASAVKTTSNGSKDIRVQADPVAPSEPAPEAAPASEGGGVIAAGATPNETLAAFKTAATTGDPALVNLFATTTDEEKQAVQAIASIIPAGKRLEQALVSKFGDEAKEAMKQMQSQGGGGGAFGSIDEFDPASVEFQVDGDTARAQVSGREMVMKLVDGVWKIDLASAGMDGPAAQMMVAMAPQIGQAMNDFAGEVEAGKYGSLQEAMAMFMQKMMQSMGGGGGNP